MKLTEREVELISKIDRNRFWRRRGAWVGLVMALVAWFLASYFEWSSNSSGIVIGMVLGFAIVYLASAYSPGRADDKLNDVLQRYVNNDPEALRQLSTVKSAGTSEKQAQSF